MFNVISKLMKLKKINKLTLYLNYVLQSLCNHEVTHFCLNLKSIER